MCIDPFSAMLIGTFLGGKPGVMSTPAIYQTPEQPKTANFSQQGLLFQKRKRKRWSVKTTPLGLEDEETQKKQLTGE